MKLGYIGFGEVGFEMAQGFGAAGLKGIVAYDLLQNHPAYGALVAERVRASGVTMCSTPQTLLDNVDVVIVAVPGGKALETAKQQKQLLKKGTIYADVSASSPETKRQIWDEIKETGVMFVDGAMLGSLTLYKNKVPTLVSGNGSDLFMERMSPYGMDLEKVSDIPGEATAIKLGLMAQRGDQLKGDVIIATHICPTAPTRPHHPVAFMDSPVDFQVMNDNEIDPAMDAVLSIDTTKGNRIINTRGFAISPTVKSGYVLRVSDDLLDIMQNTTGRLPAVFAITTQDITPYGNGIFHLNSIMQPSIATDAPTVGVAITTEAAVPGCATGATHLVDVEMAVRFAIETAKAFTSGQCHFYDPEEFNLIQTLYGSLDHLRTAGRKKE